MNRQFGIYVFSLVMLLSSSVQAVTTAAKINGNLKITAADGAIIFPDGTAQSTATLQGTQGIQGPQGPPGTDAIITVNSMCTAITASGMEVPAFCTNPSKFSMEWLSGKTLYDVWYGMASDANGNPKPGDFPGVARMTFGTDGILQVQGLLNDEVNVTINYHVNESGRMYAGTDDGSGFIAVSGGTSKYIKTYHLNPDGSFDNVDLFFFNEADAMLYANGLSSSIPK